MLHGSTHERTAISSDKHGKDNRDRGADKDGKLLQSLIQPLRKGSAYWGAPAAHSAPRTWSARPSLTRSGRTSHSLPSLRGHRPRTAGAVKQTFTPARSRHRRTIPLP